MMGGGDVGLLKVGRRRPKSPKQAEASLAILQKILPIAVRLRPNPSMAAVAALPEPQAAECGKPARSDVIKLSEPDIQTA